MKTVVACLGTLLLTASAAAQTNASVTADPAGVPAGVYQLDPHHASVIARLAHRGGVSFSTFRFYEASGKLDWNPADPAKIQLNVTVDMTSLQSPVPNFAATLIGDRFLKTGQFHDATFVSKSVERTGPSTAKITGDLTFMGQTRQVTMEAILQGATTIQTGEVAGFAGTLRFKRSDFGFTTMIGPIGDEIEMILDVEFDKPA